MEIFVLQVKTGAEEKFLRAAERLGVPRQGRLCFPRRTLAQKKGGRLTQRDVPFFKGYLFYFCTSLSEENRDGLRRVPGFISFLPGRERILPLPPDEREFIYKLITGGDVIGLSRVRFDENRRIIVSQGPLKGFEGNIVSVDKRKGRARVQLDLYRESYLIDLGFERLDSLENS